MVHIPLNAKRELTTYRKISIASWRHPRDPSTYSWLDLPVEEAEAFLKNYPSETRPSMTHYVAKIVAHCLEKHPDLNCLLRKDALYPRARTDVFITTLIKDAQGANLSGFTIPDATHMSLGDIASHSRDAAECLRRGQDEVTNRIDTLTRGMPIWLMRIVMTAQDFVHYTLNVSLRRFGLPDDRFGSFMISNFGVLGIDNALIPLSPYCRCPLIIGIGSPKPMPIVRDGEVVAAKCVTISFTFDHRYADGVHGGLLMRQFKKVFLSPTRHAAVFNTLTTAEDGQGSEDAMAKQKTSTDEEF